MTDAEGSQAPKTPTAAKTPTAKAPKAGKEPEPAPEPTGDHLVLRDMLGDDHQRYEELADGVGVSVIAPPAMLDAAGKVRSMGYRLLSLLSAYDGGDHFGVLYAFVKPASTPAEFGEIRLRVVMPKKEGDRDVEPECQSLCGLFPAANWQEREMYDMYGIRFDGHPDLRRMFLPEGWEGYPMRKDYKEPEQFIAMADGEDVVYKTQEEGSW